MRAMITEQATARYVPTSPPVRHPVRNPLRVADALGPHSNVVDRGVEADERMAQGHQARSMEVVVTGVDCGRGLCHQVEELRDVLGACQERFFT